MLLIALGGFFLNSALPVRHGVLGYATDMSVQSLLDDTNSQRSGNGLGGLSLNSELIQAAQAKANDMVARDYWSHNTPDGQTPWSFITAAGYNYQTAGENLAYGFLTASDTLTGWMNSPEHRANILNTTYKEVGFGIANSANYQGTGPETVVVAEYAEPVGPVISAAPTSSTPIATAPAATTPSTSTPVAESTPTPAAAATPTAQPTANPTPVVTTQTKLAPIAETPPVRVSRIQTLTAGKAPWSMFALTVLMASGIVIFFMRHALAWHKVIRKGERFIIRHPALDIAATTVIVIGLLLSRTTGFIR